MHIRDEQLIQVLLKSQYGKVQHPAASTFFSWQNVLKRTFMNGALWCCRGASAYKPYFPVERVNAYLVQTLTKITSSSFFIFSLYIIFPTIMTTITLALSVKINA